MSQPLVNVLSEHGIIPKVPRPAGSGRPNKGRKLISVWIAQSGVDHLDALAAEFDVSRSDLIRDALKAGLPLVERKLRKP